MKKTFFERYYFTIFFMIALLMFPMLRGAKQAILSNTNNVKDWLPQSEDVSQQLTWFQKHFPGQSFALVSWEGCTLGNTESVNLLAQKLVPEGEPAEGFDLEGKSTEARCRRYFHEVITGPSEIAKLQDEPLSLSYGAAVGRLEGALIGARPEGSEENEDRTTCLIVTLTDAAKVNNRNMQSAIETIEEVARAECGLSKETNIRMGGPPVDNVSIDKEGQRTLFRLAVLSGIVGIGLSYWCLRCWSLTWFVFAVGVLSATVSLAIVHYYGMFEYFVLGYGPDFGTADAILMSMPAVVYVLGLSGAIHIINYYRDEVHEHGPRGAAEAAVSHGWLPCTLAALTTAIGIGSLFISDITPIKKFGIFTAAGVLATLLILFTVLPACMVRFPPKSTKKKKPGDLDLEPLPEWGRKVANFIISRNKLVCGSWLLVMVFVGYGMTKIETSVQLLKLFDRKADIIEDYAWLERHLGNLVPMEVVLRVDPASQRLSSEHAEADGEHYRMTLLERLELVRRVRDRMESMNDIGKSLSAVDFAPKMSRDRAPGLHVVGIKPRLAMNRNLEKREDDLLGSGWKGYVAHEQTLLSAIGNSTEKSSKKDAPKEEGYRFEDAAPSAELWRVSARVGALNDVDYGVFIEELRNEIDPLVSAYRWRDKVVRSLHQQGKRLGEKGQQAKVALLVQIDETNRPWDDHHPAWVLKELLKEAGAKVQPIDLARYSTDGVIDRKAQAQLRLVLEAQDCVVVATGIAPLVVPEAEEANEPLANTVDAEGLIKGLPAVVTVDRKPTDHASTSVSAVYTGVVPLVYKTQRKLLASLEESVGTAALIIAVIMMFVLKSPSAGLVSMIPNVFPIVIIFGSMGWMGIKVDIGIMMTASVALGVAVDDTIHFLYWFRKGMEQLGDRKRAAMLAYERCGRAMFQTTIIGGFGLSVFAFSTFTPTQQFGYLMITMLLAALVGDLLLLPAILAGPIGKFFCGRLTGPTNGESSDTIETPIESLIEPMPASARVRQDAPHRSVRTGQ